MEVYPGPWLICLIVEIKRKLQPILQLFPMKIEITLITLSLLPIISIFTRRSLLLACSLSGKVACLKLGLLSGH